MSLRPFALALSLAMTACRPSPASDATPDPPTDAPAEASGGSTAVGAGAAQPSEPRPTDALAEGSAAASALLADAPDPVALAADIRQAILAEDIAALEDALRELGRNLSSWRAHPQPELAAALRRLSTASAADVRRRLDARYVPAVVEMLIDAGDMGAVQRLTMAWQNSVAEPVLAGPRNLAMSRAPTLTLDLTDVDDGCELFVDDAPASPATLPVVPGSHLVRCGPDGSELIVLGDPHETVRITGDDRGLIVTR